MNSNEELVAYLKNSGWADEQTARAMLANPREQFVPFTQQKFAYSDYPLPIGFGQTISAPSMVAEMTKLLELREGIKVLEVGAGSGWQAALIAFLIGKKGRLYTIERIPELAEMARKNVEKFGYKNCLIVYGDGSKGYEEKAPFDRIIVTAAAPEVPQPLVQQLADNSRLLIPVGGPYWQELTLVEKRKGETTRSTLMSVVFVPLIGEYGYKQ